MKSYEVKVLKKLLFIIIFILIIITNTFAQIKFGDYDCTGKFGFSIMNFNKPRFGLEVGGIIFKNRNNNSKILSIYSVTALTVDNHNNTSKLFGIKVGAEQIYTNFILSGLLLNATKEELLFLDNELYFVPQIGFSGLLLVNLYIGYNIKLIGNGKGRTSANLNISLYFNMIDII